MKSEAGKKVREEIREMISPPLDSAMVSAGGRGPPVLAVCQGVCPLPFYTLRVPVIPPQGRGTVVYVQSFFS